MLAHKTDGIDDAFAKADVVVEHTIRNQRLIHVPIETRGVVADWNPATDDLVVYSSTQVPHFLRTFLAIVCGVSEAKVRAIAPGRRRRVRRQAERLRRGVHRRGRVAQGRRAR